MIAFARPRSGRLSGADAARVSLMEARLRALGNLDAQAAPPAQDCVWKPPRYGRRIGAYAQVAFWALLLGAFAIGWYVIDRGGHATTLTPMSGPAFASGSGHQPVMLASDDVTVRVTVASAGVWFWCLESSITLPSEQHVCRDSGEAPSVGTPVVTEGTARLEAAVRRGSTFRVQMYCRDDCSWRAETLPATN